MPYLTYIYGGVAGLFFGSIIAYLNSLITKHYIKKNKDSTNPEGTAAVLGVSLLRQFIDIAALAAVFFLRKVIPLPFTAVLIGTAVGLTAVSFLFIWRISRS